MALSISTVALGFASLFFLLIAGGGAAETHIDCDKVMHELVNGKSAQEVAKELSISVTTVYDCENANAAMVRQAPSALPSASISPFSSSPR
jgi:hypothetical protein